MDFILDENVANAVIKTLEAIGCRCYSIRSFAGEGTPDMAVAALVNQRAAILVSHNKDFKKIAPRISGGSRRRFRQLSRILLKCKASRAAERLAQVMDFVQYEIQVAQSKDDKRVILEIGDAYIRSDR
jgi:hypothetical protein